MEVEVCYAEVGRAWRVALSLASGATVGDALDASGVAALIEPAVEDLGLAVFGRRATRSTVLADGDRVELLRPLLVDPMEARRRRSLKKRGSGA